MTFNYRLDYSWRGNKAIFVQSEAEGWVFTDNYLYIVFGCIGCIVSFFYTGLIAWFRTRVQFHPQDLHSYCIWP